MSHSTDEETWREIADILKPVDKIMATVRLRQPDLNVGEQLAYITGVVMEVSAEQVREHGLTNALDTIVSTLVVVMLDRNRLIEEATSRAD